MHSRKLQALHVLPLLLILPLWTGCATVTGTLVSPITGGVDLVKEDVPDRAYGWVVPAFLAGAIAGPFVALYNGVQYDAAIFRDWDGYWRNFDEIFRPFETVRK